MITFERYIEALAVVEQYHKELTKRHSGALYDAMQKESIGAFLDAAGELLTLGITRALEQYPPMESISSISLQALRKCKSVGEKGLTEFVKCRDKFLLSVRNEQNIQTNQETCHAEYNKEPTQNHT
jgi:hypothetical protein